MTRLEKLRDELAERRSSFQSSSGCKLTDQVWRRHIEIGFADGFNEACNLLLPEIEKLRELLQDSLEVRTVEAPEDVGVKELGERIGFGALLSAAVKGWHQSAKEKEYPPGGSFTVGHCHSTVESALASLEEFLNEK